VNDGRPDAVAGDCAGSWQRADGPRPVRRRPSRLRRDAIGPRFYTATVATGRRLCNRWLQRGFDRTTAGRSRMSASSPVPARPRKILMATDLSARCDRALDRALQLSVQWQAPLQVVHAAPREAIGAQSAADTLASIRRRIERDLDDDAIDVRVEEGDPAEVVLDVARRSGSDLIVLGDASGVPGRRLLGNTVETLVRSTPASVLVVKQRPRGGYRRVLVGTDLTPESRHGLDTAAASLLVA